jgi:hypothetical protein
LAGYIYCGLAAIAAGPPKHDGPENDCYSDAATVLTADIVCHCVVMGRKFVLAM